MSDRTPDPRCPACNSLNVVTTPKPSASSYWRCSDCGELWNPSRVSERYRYGATARTARRTER